MLLLRFGDVFSSDSSSSHLHQVGQLVVKKILQLALLQLVSVSFALRVLLEHGDDSRHRGLQVAHRLQVAAFFNDGDKALRKGPKPPFSSFTSQLAGVLPQRGLMVRMRMDGGGGGGFIGQQGGGGDRRPIRSVPVPSLHRLVHSDNRTKQSSSSDFNLHEYSAFMKETLIVIVSVFKKRILLLF